MTKSRKEPKYKCPFCPQTDYNPQLIWSHIRREHPETFTISQSDPPKDNPEIKETDGSSQIKKQESNSTPDVEKSNFSKEEIEQIVNKSRTLEGEKEDLKKQLEAKEKEESKRRKKMAEEEEVTRRVERLEAEKKEAEKQEQLRKRREQDAKIDKLVKGQQEQGQKLTLIGNMVCDEKGNCRLPTKEDMTNLATKDELQASFGTLKEDVITTLKPEKTKEEKKKEEEPKPEIEFSEKDKQILEDFPKVRNHVNALTGEQKDSPFGVLAAATKHAQQTILDSGKPVEELVKFVPDELKRAIQEGGGPEQLNKQLESMKSEEKAHFVKDLCAGKEGSAICKILRDEGINIQKKREGGGMLGGDWKDVD